MNTEQAKTWSEVATDNALLRSLIDTFSEAIVCDDADKERLIEVGGIIGDEILRRMGGYRNN